MTNRDECPKLKDSSNPSGIKAARGNSFGADEYNVRTGIDVSATDPVAAMLSAIAEMGLQDADSYCYHVEHLRSGKKWEVELLPEGKSEITDFDQ